MRPRSLTWESPDVSFPVKRDLVRNPPYHAVEGLEAVPFLSWRNLRECLLGASGIAAACWIGEAFYKVSGTVAAPLWPSSGLALGLLLLCGWRLAPAISLGTAIATTTFGDPHLFSLFGSVGNTLESLTGWFLMRRIFGFSNQMGSVRDVLVLLLAGAPWGTLLSAVICTLGLVAVGIVKPSSIPLSALLFWTGNVLGILIFTPLILNLSGRFGQKRGFGLRPADAFWMALLLGIVIVGFALPGTAHTGFIPLAYLSFPVLVWLAYEWKSDVTLPLSLITLMMTAFTVTGHGPLLRADPFATYAEMTIFIIIYGVSCLLISAAAMEGDHHAALALSREVDSARKDLELRGMRAGLNPHFLFNSLNVIKALAAENPGRAGEAIVALSGILRSSLKATGQSLVPLSTEMAVIHSYLSLQKMRMEDRLETTINGEEDARDFPVPPMLLHQLVENAFKHSPPGKVSIGIDIRREVSGLRFRVSNPGTFTDRGDGLGLRTIRAQLRALYGEDAHFRIEEDARGRTNAEILIIGRADAGPSPADSGL